MKRIIFATLFAIYSFSSQSGEGSGGGGPKAFSKPEETRLMYQIKEPVKIESIIGTDGQEIEVNNSKNRFDSFQKVDFIIFKNGENYTKDEILQNFLILKHKGIFRFNGIIFEVNTFTSPQPSPDRSVDFIPNVNFKLDPNPTGNFQLPRYNNARPKKWNEGTLNNIWISK